MKRSVIALFILCLFASNTFAQNFVQTEEEYKEYEQYLEEYYKNTSAEEIWRDYIELKLKQDGNLAGLVYPAGYFKEPFKTWVVRELLNMDLTISELGSFLWNDFPEKAKATALKRFLDFQSQPILKISAPYLERLIDLVLQLSGNYIVTNPTTIIYREYFIDRILSDPNMVYVSNDYLMSILKLGSLEQRKKIAERVLYNDPPIYALDIIADAKIDFYSDLANNMFLQQKVTNPIPDSNYDFDVARRTFLVKKMSLFK